MGVSSQRYLDRQFSLNGFGNESYSRLEKQNENFDLKYSKKKNDKINFSFRRKLYKSKFYISESYFQLLKTNKVFVEIFIAIVVLFNEAKNKKRKKNMFFGISKKTLEEICGFKKTSIKYAIKKFLEIGIIDKDFWTNFKLIKPLKKDLKNEGEKFIKIESENAWKIFLLFGLKTLKTYQLLQWKSRMIFDKKFNSISSRKKVVLQNSFFNFERHLVYKYLKNIADFFWVPYKKMFGIVRHSKKRFISIKAKLKHSKKFIGFNFITKRYLLMQV